ncbi:MAG: pentapeptide repeat-containing protein [Candidatus Taylorbacteria bacterium]|nr:pentapeptide repeat-containing protein [Candidatus Taylorbacteria bacterium]
MVTLRIRLLIVIALVTIAIVDISDSRMGNPDYPQYEVIAAEDIQAKINGSQVSYDQAYIVGDLDLANREFKSFRITNSVIEGNASFSNVIFSEKTEFKNTSFLKSALFYKTRFNGEAGFEKSHFYQAANFSESRFSDGATFDGATFEKQAIFLTAKFANFGSFNKAKFYGPAEFYLSQFDGIYANFGSTQFREKADFVGTQFTSFLSFVKSKMEKDADFHASTFSGGVNFGEMTCQGSARFDRSYFGKDSQFCSINFSNNADFRSVTFDESSFFKDTRFGGDALFDNAQFNSPSDFNGTRFGKDLAMNSTKISTMVFDGAIFNSSSRLFLSKADINRLMIRWELIKNILVYDSSAYLSLVRNYRDLGLSEAEDCYYQYRKITQDLKSWEPSKILDILAYITCGYGVRVERPLLCSLFVILGCMAALWIGDGLKHHAIKDQKTSIYDSLYYCLAIFFTIPLPDLKPVGRYRYVPVFLRALGWTLFALLIATLGKVMIK